jgi:site-specific DNA-methyltransferase (cytosine-N4-specific)
MQPTLTLTKDLNTHRASAWTIHQGDCLTAASAYPDNTFQLLLTSPPYPGLHGFPLTGRAYHDWLHERLAAWVPKVCAQTGVTVLVYKYGRTDDGWFDLDQLLLLKEIEQQHGLHLVDLYPWDKLNAPPAGSHDRHDRDEWEITAVFARSTDYFYHPVRKPYSPKTIAKNRNGNPRQADVLGKHTNGHARLHPKGARQGNVLRISSSGDQGRPRVTGGSFPRQLAERFILQHSRRGDAVVDVFCGAGTTLAEAVRLGRTAVGVDDDAVAVETAVGWLREVSA